MASEACCFTRSTRRCADRARRMLTKDVNHIPARRFLSFMVVLVVCFSVLYSNSRKPIGVAKKPHRPAVLKAARASWLAKLLTCSMLQRSSWQRSRSRRPCRPCKTKQPLSVHATRVRRQTYSVIATVAGSRSNAQGLQKGMESDPAKRWSLLPGKKDSCRA